MDGVLVKFEGKIIDVSKIYKISTTRLQYLSVDINPGFCFNFNFKEILL